MLVLYLGSRTWAGLLTAVCSQPLQIKPCVMMLLTDVSAIARGYLQGVPNLILELT